MDGHQNSPLVSPDWLAERSENPDLRVVEISNLAEDTLYREGHVPGAVWKYWKQFCWHETDRQFPTPEEMAHRLGEIGVTPQTMVVVYGAPVQYGTYAFWVLTMAGHRNLKLLDGSRKGWEAARRPFSNEVSAWHAVDYRPGVGDSTCRIGRDGVREGLGKPGRILLDVRSPEEYSGERVMEYGHFDHGAERGGRIPGAAHLYFRQLLREDDRYKNPEELRAVFAGVGITPGMEEEVVVYCRLSHRATLAWFAMHHILGIERVRIYDGSWTEWGSLVGFPVEK